MEAGYESLGSFYLGRKFDLANRKLLEDYVCYDSKDLTTHAMCVGMTGSGKTGLCLALLEEAALDGIPAIAIDPKGDIGNLLLAFPNLEPKDFQPWLDEGEAARQGMDAAQLAEKTAARWRQGLEDWGQSPERIQRFRDSVDIAIYTPGSNAGIPMTVLRSFNAPSEDVKNDSDLYRERIAGAASGLLTLLGIDADPLTSREHILLSNIFSHEWNNGRDLELGTLIRLIQTPPITKIGVVDLDSFYPSADRMKLAMTLNNLLASPSFAGWLEGQPLDIQSLLYTADKKPRLSIISIAHLSDQERMFFVTILLNELLGWMRGQQGTSSLRALFYMDEVYGYFPPSAKPPSKPPMLVLLKQARAFGLGIALATQNPVDLDYKGLANIGTWFLGRLQTERDKARVLEGLEGASLQSGTKFDRNEMERMLASLGSRVFLMNNVHDDSPTVFQSRWALSFLRGPLSRQNIQTLMEPRRAALTAGRTPAKPIAAANSESARGSTGASPATQAPASKTMQSSSAISQRPILSADIPERFCAPSPNRRPSGSAVIEYRPALLGMASCHYVKSTVDIDHWQDSVWIAGAFGALADDPWSEAIKVDGKPLVLTREPISGAACTFEELAPELLSVKSYKRWQTQLKDFLYRHEPLKLFQCEELDSVSRPGQDEFDARMGLEQRMREARDEAKEKLQAKYASQINALESKIATAKAKADRENADVYKAALDIGQSVLGMLIGNKRSRVSKTSATARGIGRAAKERSDSNSARELLNSLLDEKAVLESKCYEELEALKERYSVQGINLTPLEIPCRKSDIRLDLVGVVWLPWAVADGMATPLVDAIAEH